MFLSERLGAPNRPAPRHPARVRVEGSAPQVLSDEVSDLVARASMHGPESDDPGSRRAAGGLRLGAILLRSLPDRRPVLHQRAGAGGPLKSR